jgi:hypothetical protein
MDVQDNGAKAFEARLVLEAAGGRSGLRDN